MRRWIGVFVLAGVSLGGAWATAQPDNPVYANDSPLASDTLGRLDDLLSVESYAEVSRALQQLLDDEGQRVLRSPDDETLFYPVRELVHERLLASAALLERYREIEGPRARAMMEQGDWREVERSRLLTRAGFESALRVAQEHLEHARFYASIRTLSSLDAHPDREGRAGADAARLLAQAVRYVDDERARELARAWAEQTGAAGLDLSKIETPPSVLLDVRAALTPDQQGAGIEIASLSSTPLRSETLSPVSELALDAPTALRDQPAAQRTRPRTYAWSMPTVVGDVLYVSDGITVSAWDRYTLGEIWRRRIGPPPGQGDRDRFVEATRQRLGQGLEDSASVTISGSALLTTSGLARSGGRQDGNEVVCLDRATGRVRWSVDVSTLDESLEGASVRGPVLVDGHRVIVTARKAIRSRRLVGVSFVGLDLQTGAHRWTLPLASAGSLPFQTFGYIGEAGVAHEGVVYRTDSIGVVGAVESETGRPVWARTLPPSALYTNTARSPWNTPVPIVHDGSLITISPDREEVLRLDLQTGAILGRREADAFGRPQYMLRVGGSLALVGEDRIAFVDIRRFEQDPVRMSQRIDPVSISGRCAASGGSVLVPTHEGVLAIDPERPREPELVPLELTGNLITVPGQLIAIGEFEAHSYLVWEKASSLLRDRMRQAPDDPAPSAAFAELAYRSGRFEEIAPALDEAISALRRDARHAPLEARLFDAVLDMVRADPESGVTSLKVRRSLIERLGRLARTPEHRVSHLMVSGRLHETAGQPADAVAAYQRILGDRSLAGSTWRGSTLAVRAELEASRRVRDVVLAHGMGAYAGFDGEARVELSLLTPQSEPGEISAIARRYPASSVTPELWLRAGAAYDKLGRPHASERALRAALTIAETLEAAGSRVEGKTLGEIVGRLAASLAVNARANDAGEVIDRGQRINPGIVPTSEGAPIDLSRLSTMGRARVIETAPNIGREIRTQQRPRLLTGVPLPTPEGASLGGDRTLLFSRERAELSLLVATPSGLEQAWVRDAPGEPTLLHAGASGALIHWNGGQGGVLEHISLGDGRPGWDLGPLESLLSEMSDRAPGTAPMAHDRGEFLTPTDGMVSPRGVLHAIDGQTLVIADRSGRLGAYDLVSGRELWTRRSRLARVFDVDVNAGVLAVGGETLGESGALPLIIALDARTGEVISPIEGVSSQVRWVRVSRLGDLIAGLNGAVVSMNVVEGRINWVMNGLATEKSLGAYLFDETILLIDADRALWIGDASDGRLNALELDTRGRVRPSGPIHASVLGDHLLVSGSGGVALFDREGKAVGIDALDTPGDTLPAATARGTIVLLERSHAGARLQTRLHLLDAASAMLLASHPLATYDTPSAITCIDGHVLLSVGGATMVIEAPAP